MILLGTILKSKEHVNFHFNIIADNVDVTKLKSTYIQKNLLQNGTPEIGCEIYVFINPFFFGQKSCGLIHGILRPHFFY